MLIDTHAHIMLPEFAEDVDQVLVRAKEAGLGKIVNVGFDLDSISKSIEMAQKYPDFLYATVGLHPYDSGDFSEDLMEEWEGLIRESKKIVAVGETGLDYVKSTVSPEIQKKSFRGHLQLARKTGLPVIVHNRGADEDALDLLSKFDGRDGEPKVRAVFHCFGSDWVFARRVWNAGYYTSFTGIITYPNAEELRGVVREAPIERIMIETDCPYLAPQKYRGKRNEPAYVKEVLEKIVEVKNGDRESIERLIERNTREFFGLR